MINHCNTIYQKRMEMISDEMVVDQGFWDDGYSTVEWDMFLNCLDDKHRVVVMLYYVQGFKTREIAEILQINESTIRSRLANARKQMAERISYE